MKKIWALSLFFISVLLFSISQLNAVDRVLTGFLNQTAVGGFDTVSYFTEGSPQKGQEQFQTSYNGATWLFVSKKNMELFKENPEKYAPQYGGYCAWAVSRGYTANGDPLVWFIHEQKLYLNYSLSVQNNWLEEIQQNISLADRNWPNVLN